MLPRGRGADVAATKGDGAILAPLGVGSSRIRAIEAFGVVWLPPRRTGAVPWIGALAPSAPTAATFGLFLLPGGCPWRFFLTIEEPVVAEADEESMELGFFREE
jgi:hypothetical protein